MPAVLAVKPAAARPDVRGLLAGSVGTAWTDAGPLAGGLMLALGGYGLRARRKELELRRELAVADLSRELDQQIEREGRAAAMLTLTAGVAHEISTPLSVIHGRADRPRVRP
jgi:signal transduction histidine kinase